MTSDITGNEKIDIVQQLQEAAADIETAAPYRALLLEAAEIILTLRTLVAINEEVAAEEE